MILLRRVAKESLLLSIRRALLLTAVLVTASCGDDTPTSPTTPEPPPTVTENFSGTLNPNGGRTHTFQVGTAGAVTATLTSVSPDDTLVVGFSLGTWNTVLCQAVLPKDDAKQGTVINGTAGSFGTLCVRIYDVGNLTGNISYEIQVVHP